jgi:endoglucanase
MKQPTRRDVIKSLMVASSAFLPGSGLRSEPANAAFRRGINLWPWFALTREFPPPSRAYAWPPFESNRPRPSAADLAALHRVGFDFVRLPVDPGPFLAANRDQGRQLLATVERAVESILAAGLSIVLDLHPNEATHFWNAQQMLDESPRGSFGSFVDLVVDAARLLRTAPDGRATLELMNEPPPPCGSADWQKQQLHLLATVRSTAPDLRVMLTGACGSLPEGLLTLAPTDDPNVVFTFHYYWPYLFTHQGATWMTEEPIYRYLRSVPWPATAGDLDSTVAIFRDQVMADAALSKAEREALLIQGRDKLATYFAAEVDRSNIDKDFAPIDKWRELHNISSDRILLGEFGATKWASPLDRARYVRDVRGAAEARGFGWAFWNLFDVMGITVDDQTHVLDGAILAALGLQTPDGG